MSRRSGHRPKRHQRNNVEPFPARHDARADTDEPRGDGDPILGGAMTLAVDACQDDSPSVLAEGPGATLRRAREARRLSLDDIARRTKIGKATLLALEAGDVQRLPATIYTRGFIKVVAREVGLDPERTADAYLGVLEHDTGAPHAPRPDAAFTTSGATPVPGAGDVPHQITENGARRFGRVTTAAAVIGLIVYVATFGARDERSDPTVDAAPVAEDGDAVTASRADDHAVSPTDVVEATHTPLRVELTSHAPCWLSAVVDGERVLSRTLQAGERHALAVDEEAVLRIGEPSALSISINGQPGRPLGRPGQPVSVTITRDNYHAFLIS